MISLVAQVSENVGSLQPMGLSLGQRLCRLRQAGKLQGGDEGDNGYLHAAGRKIFYQVRAEDPSPHGSDVAALAEADLGKESQSYGKFGKPRGKVKIVP